MYVRINLIFGKYDCEPLYIGSVVYGDVDLSVGYCAIDGNLPAIDHHGSTPNAGN